MLPSSLSCGTSVGEVRATNWTVRQLHIHLFSIMSVKALEDQEGNRFWGCKLDWTIRIILSGGLLYCVVS